ncbi:MAG: hypothetical protein CFH43_00128, partial [Proteobacteria bacterium]
MNSNFILRLLGYNINQSIKDLNTLKLLSEDVFWEQQIQKRDKILQHHLRNTLWYGKFVGNVNNLDWSEIPIITKNDLQNFTLENNAKNHSIKRYYFANTSGSTGYPFSFWKDKPCHSLA